jgi:hypothetical protein
MPLGCDNADSFVLLTSTMLMMPITSPVAGSYTGLPLLPGYAVASS